MKGPHRIQNPVFAHQIPSQIIIVSSFLATTVYYPLLLLRTKSRRTNIAPPQLNTQNLLHARQDLLVWSRRSALEVRDDTLRRVALGRQILLRHLRLHLLPLLGDHRADFLANSVGLDDIITAIDLGEMLAFDAGFGGLVRWNVSGGS
jgi:hypothetical protein